MKKSIPIILGIIWLIFIASLAFQDGVEWKQRESMNLCQDGIWADDRAFVLENRETGGIIYEIGRDKQVRNIFFSEDYQKNLRIAQIAYEEALYALLADGDGRYHILELDSFMLPVASSAILDLGENSHISGFSADETGFYLTLIGQEADIVYTYFLEKEGSLQAIEKEAEEKKTESVQKEQNKEEKLFLRTIRLWEAEKGRRIIDADFQDGEYQIRLDNGSGSEAFLLSDEILESYYGRQLSAMQTLKFQREKLVQYGQLLLLGYVVLVAGVIILRNKSHAVYTIVTVEIILLCVTVMGAVLAYRMEKKAKNEQQKIFGEYYLGEVQRQVGDQYQFFVSKPDFYDSKIYHQVWEELNAFVAERGPDRLLESVALVRNADYRVMVSSAGRNNEHAAYAYTTQAMKLLDALKKGRKADSIQVFWEGSPYLIVGVSEPDRLTSAYSFIGMIKAEQNEVEEETIRKYIYFVEALFLIGSGVTIFLILFQERELRKLGKAMFLVASGSDEIKKEDAYGRDIQWMWSSLLEISKRIGRINHTKFRLYESCYRFAPKDIEKILGKDSITEVESGDVIDLYGTVAIINCAKTNQVNLATMSEVNEYIGLLEKYKEQKDGFFLSGDNDLKSLKILFLQSCKTSMDFGTGFIKEFQKMETYHKFKTGILLHYDRYRYGIAGTKEQCFSFLLYEEMERMEKLGYWLETMGIKLAVTESVKCREETIGSSRYIGYIRLKNQTEEIRLYEILDACSEEERKKKQALDVKFQKAIQLFYEYNFYLSRSTFSEVLKDHPEDQIAKWYLFTCETYLNQSYAGEVNFELCGER